LTTEKSPDGGGGGVGSSGSVACALASTDPYISIVNSKAKVKAKVLDRNFPP